MLDLFFEGTILMGHVFMETLKKSQTFIIIDFYSMICFLFSLGLQWAFKQFAVAFFYSFEDSSTDPGRTVVR